MADPSKFVDVTMNIRKKRTAGEANINTTNEEAEVKRRKLNEEDDKPNKDIT